LNRARRFITVFTRALRLSLPCFMPRNTSVCNFGAKTNTHYEAAAKLGTADYEYWGISPVTQLQNLALQIMNTGAYRQLRRMKMGQIKQVNLSPRLIRHHAMKTYGGAEAQLHGFFTSTLDGGEWSASRSGPLTPGSVRKLKISQVRTLVR
jgi:hypothetical protein